MNNQKRMLILGRDHEEWDAIDRIDISDRTVCAIARGSDRDSPSARSKRHPNEDALLVIEDDRRILLAVADGHFGREASHEVLRVLEERCRPVPGTPDALHEIFHDLRRARARPEYQSATSLVVVILDRMFRQGFGLSYGDSTVCHVAADGVANIVNRRAGVFVTPADPKSFSVDRAHRLSFVTSPGDLLMVFTDGIDECSYGDPFASITPEVMERLIADNDRDPGRFVDSVCRLAMDGVKGNPGGQDNVVIGVTRT